MLSADEILELWEWAHGALPAARRTTFLGRGEVRELGSHPPAAVAAAITESPKLEVIVARTDDRVVVPW